MTGRSVFPAVWPRICPQIKTCTWIKTQNIKKEYCSESNPQHLDRAFQVTFSMFYLHLIYFSKTAATQLLGQNLHQQITPLCLIQCEKQRFISEQHNGWLLPTPRGTIVLLGVEQETITVELCVTLTAHYKLEAKVGSGLWGVCLSYVEWFMLIHIICLCNRRGRKKNMTNQAISSRHYRSIISSII